MGLAASQARLLMLTNRCSNLEFKGMNISQKRMELANKTSNLLEQEQNQSNQASAQNSSGGGIGGILSSVGGAIGGVVFGEAGSQLGSKLGGLLGGLFGGGSSEKSESSSKGGNIKAQLAQLQQEDKELEMKLNQIDTQHKAVQTEMDSVKKVIDKNIERSFKILG